MAEHASQADLTRLAGDVASNHDKANRNHLEVKTIATDNRRRLDELTGRSGDAGIVRDVAEVKTDLADVKKEVTGIKIKLGGALAGLMIMIELVSRLVP